MFKESEILPVRRPCYCPSVLGVLVGLQWVVIAGVCAFVYLYVNLQKEHMDMVMKRKNLTLACCQFSPTELRNQVGESEKPMAHFTALEVDPNVTKRLLFESTKGHAFNTLGMKYNLDGSMVVPKEGIYFIYAQVTFSCMNECPGVSHPFSASIHKKNKQYHDPDMLLKSHIKPQTDMENYIKVSTYQAGIFQLLKNDSLYVEIIKGQGFKVSTKEHETYFGAFLLQSVPAPG